MGTPDRLSGRTWPRGAGGPGGVGGVGGAGGAGGTLTPPE